MTKSGSSYKFTTYREFVTSDPNGEDYQFETEEPLEMQWVVNEDTSDLKKHTKTGDFTLNFETGIEDSAQYGISATLAAVAAWAMLI